MMHALVRNAAIVLTGPLPYPTWPDPEAGRWWDMRDPAQVTEAGWVEVAVEPRPDDTATTTWERKPPELVDGLPVIGWVEVPKTPERIAAEEADAAHEADRLLVRAIITDLQAEKSRAQAVIDKTNAQISGGDTKDVARAAKRIADAAIDLARFVKDQ